MERFTNKSPDALTMEQAIARHKKRIAEDKLQFRRARELAARGRGEDTEIAHVELGELVIPRALQNPEVLTALRRAAAAHNIPLEMLSVGNAMNRINPNTGASEFWFDDWKDKISNFLGDREGAQAATEGAAARAAHSGISNDLLRGRYDEQVVKLDPFANAEREGLKAEFRQQMPPELRVFVKDKPLNARDGSIGRANVTNPVATEQARILGRMGRGAGVLGAGLAIADVATSDNPARAAFANVGGLGGGILGGAMGGALGALTTGAAAVVAAPTVALTGSAIGGNVGYRGAERLYDFADEQLRRWSK